jgi:hypothetical protein
VPSLLILDFLVGKDNWLVRNWFIADKFIDGYLQVYVVWGILIYHSDCNRIGLHH